VTTQLQFIVVVITIIIIIIIIIITPDPLYRQEKSEINTE